MEPGSFGDEFCQADEDGIDGEAENPVEEVKLDD